MYRIALNVTITAYRKQSRRREAPPPEEHFFRRRPGDEEDTVAVEQRLLLYTTIRRLPPADRSLLLLHFDGHDYTSISAIMGISASNVGTRLTRLRLRLAQMISPK
jgi:RNA polymerase sigma factor (sigma-70 family)